MTVRAWVVSALSAAAIVAATVLTVGVLGGVDADEAEAMTANPSVQDTARLLGYMWGDGEQNAAGVWDVNGPSGTSSLIEELIIRHGGTFVDRNRLRFTLPTPYDWDEWTSGLPNDSSAVRAAVRDPNFLAAVVEAEASVGGQIYDQSACCVNGYTVGRLNELRDLLRSSGYTSAFVTTFNDRNSGRVNIGSSQWDDLRRDLEFACPASNSVIRVPGGTNLARHGNLRWLGSNSRWGTAVRTDCTIGQSVPDVGPPVGSCTATPQGNGVRVDWTHTLGDVSIRNDGRFVEAVSARDGSWTGSASGRITIRVMAFGQRAETTCGSAPGPTGNSTCTATGSGGRVVLDWDDAGASSYSVRRNGTWVTTVRQSTATASGSVNDDWVIRYRSGGRQINVLCSGGGDDGASPCAITNRADGVRVDWDGVAGVDDYQVRRNGSWIGEASGMSRFDDRSGSVNADYEIRYRLGGNRFSIRCG